MSAPGATPAQPHPPRSDRTALVQAWVRALRNQASSAQLQALAPLATLAPESTPTGLRLQCPREQKMAVLSALATLGDRVRDIKLLEPSLEDVFFGFSA